MNKIQMFLFSLVATVLFAITPAVAQHGGRGGGHAGFGGHEAHATEGHAAVRNEGSFHAANGYRGYHYGPGAGAIRSHWNGRAFDHEFFAAHWGVGHPFFWGHCAWYGGRPFWAGSYFWYDGVYFVIPEGVIIPDYWDDGEVYVDFVDGGYVLVNPVYPGVYYHLGVRF